MRMKQVGTGLALAALLFTMPLRASALAMRTPYESKPIDGLTGKPVVTQSSNSVVSGEYDTDGYVHFVGSDTVPVSISVPDGIVTQDPVQVQNSYDTQLTLYRDGEVVAPEQWGNITEPGQYVLNYTQGEIVTRVTGFTIVRGYINTMERYVLPEGFLTTSLTVNGESMATGFNAVDLSAEGEYRIRYANSRTQQEYNLNVTVDRTPPVLEFTGLDENGIAYGPVHFSATEEGCTVTIMYNDSFIPYQESYTEFGNYTVQVWDAAGNSNTYTFIVKLYLNISAGAFIAITVATVLGFIIYLIHYRRKLRVR